MHALEYLIGDLVRQGAATAGTATEYREPLVGFAHARATRAFVTCAPQSARST